MNRKVLTIAMLVAGMSLAGCQSVLTGITDVAGTVEEVVTGVAAGATALCSASGAVESDVNSDLANNPTALAKAQADEATVAKLCAAVQPDAASISAAVAAVAADATAAVTTVNTTTTTVGVHRGGK